MMTFRIHANFCRLLLGLLCAGGLIFSAAPALAESGRHIAEFNAYNKALQAGDDDGAELHAYAAWRAAETELGDNQRTAILAYNYGRQIALSNPTMAQTPLERAASLTAAGYGGPPPQMLDLYMTYAAFATSAAKRRDPEKLRAALLAAQNQPSKRALDDIVIWLDLAKADLERERFDDAAAAASKAEAAIIVFDPDNTASLAEAFLVRGVASIRKKKPTLGDAKTARDYFENGRQLFAPQKSFDTFNPTLATLVAWNAAANAVIMSMSDIEPAADIRRIDDTPLFESAINKPADCGVEWAVRKAPDYPPGAAREAHIGAVVAVFDLAGDTAVHNPRILSEAPSDTFSAAALKAMKSWRLKAPALDHPGCRKNMTTQFSFVIDG